ncbi:MAG: IS3 family transposase [Acidobacteriota bacterium]|nr:IS3 family transposase [Acidobacteriota bacterium]
MKILAETDTAAGSGAIGALLRREGLYSSHLTHWRQERKAGVAQGLTPRARGPKPHLDPSAKEVQQLRRENERLTERLRKAEIIIDVQKKSGLVAGPDSGHAGLGGSALEVAAALLDEGHYHCSARTMYRLLAQAGETRERRDQLTHPTYQRPELLASGPNQLWSWDITKLLGPAKWTYFYLYVILDVFSRYVVGWMIAHRESAQLAKQLFEDTCRKQRIGGGQLTVHADRGSSMTSKSLAFLLSDLGVTKTHSRPHVSNDNPYSESQFRTLKYRPGFPDRFGSIHDARAFAVDFFQWYNEEHHHSGISLLTPSALHHGQASLVIEKRQAVLDAAYIVHPERFVKRPPRSHPAPTQVWINKPSTTNDNTH